MIPTSPVPDALLVPERLKSGRSMARRMDSVLDIAEPILGVDRATGGRAYIRRQPGGWLFVTRDRSDTIYHPLRTPLQGRPRYHWVDAELGIRRGYLTDAAKAASEARP